MSSRPFIVLAATLCAGPVWTQPIVTEAEFLSGIGADHPAVRAGLDRLGAAEAELARARQIANPRFEWSREQPSSDATQDTLTLAWTPPVDGRRGAAIAAARAGLAAAEAEQAARLARVRLAARDAFGAWSRTHESRAVAADVLAVAADLARRTRLKAEVGEEAGLVAGRIELQRAAIAARLAEDESSYERARAAALAWRPELGDAAPSPLLLPRDVRQPVADPALTALRNELERARHAERLARRIWAAPELQAGVQKQEQPGGRVSGPVLGVSWSVPLFDRGQAERAEATRRREVALARLRLFESRRGAAVAGAEAALARLTAAAEEAREAADLAPALVAAVVASFDAGEASVTDVLDTLRAAHDARQGEIDARAAAAAAARELDAARAGLDMGEFR